MRIRAPGRGAAGAELPQRCQDSPCILCDGWSPYNGLFMLWPAAGRTEWYHHLSPSLQPRPPEGDLSRTWVGTRQGGIPPHCPHRDCWSRWEPRLPHLACGGGARGSCDSTCERRRQSACEDGAHRHHDPEPGMGMPRVVVSGGGGTPTPGGPGLGGRLLFSCKAVAAAHRVSRLLCY